MLLAIASYSSIIINCLLLLQILEGYDFPILVLLQLFLQQCDTAWFISSFVSTPAFEALHLAFSALTITRGALLFIIPFSNFLPVIAQHFRKSLQRCKKETWPSVRCILALFWN
jgi:hypothetical protein